MPFYANYNHTVSTAVVVGWFDTDFAEYPNLPPAEDLLELTKEEWDARHDHLHWAVTDGKLHPYDPPKTITERARMALYEGAVVTLAGVLERVSFPVDHIAQARMNTVLSFIGRRHAFPGGIAAYPLLDTECDVHHLTLDQYDAVALALLEYATALDRIINGNPLNETDLPSSDLVIT